MSFSLARTPPGEAPAVLLSEERLRAHYRAWRRTLHKAKDYRVKVLHVLAGDGNGEAAGLLGEPARAYKAERCRECAGCLLMLREKACGQCNGCKGGRGCEEHHRRCREWPRNANTFHAGSVVTSVSSQFDILAADLTKYEATLEALRDLDLELEEDMDQLSPESGSRNNPRFSPEGRARELEDERNHLARLSVLLQRHGELAARLQEVAEAEEDQPVEVVPGEGGDATPLTGTQTSRQLIQMFELESAASRGARSPPDVQNDGEDRLSTVEEASLSPGLLSGGGWSQGQDALDPDDPVTQAILQPLIPVGEERTVPGITATSASTASTLPLGGLELHRVPEPVVLRPRLTGAGQDRVRFSPRVSARVFPPRPAVSQPRGPRAAGGARQSAARGTAPHERRRSQSNEGLSRASAAEASRAQMEDRKFELSAWIRTRRGLIATRLIAVEETIAAAGGPGIISPQWINEELQFVLRTLEDAEKSEMEVWKLIARIDGPESRRHRAEEWGHWFNQVMAKAGTIRGSLARPAEIPVAAPTVDVGRCQRGGGFLERVKLPQFSGSVEDYGEFKCQFQELCRGENYTRVIELAQLRQKLPKDAVALLVGLVSPDEAWARLDETYGNIDLQVFAALKRLRAFKPSKAAVQGQVVELAIAVQRCLTVLRALSREQDFLSDRETLAEVIDALPTDSQQRWYHRRGARNETQQEKGTNFLLWLEEERADAVAIHLDSLARRPKVPASQAAVQKAAVGGGATNQSVFVATSAVQPGPGGSATPVLVDPTTALTQGGGAVVKPKPPARVEVTTAAQAREVAAKNGRPILRESSWTSAPFASHSTSTKRSGHRRRLQSRLKCFRRY